MIKKNQTHLNRLNVFLDVIIITVSLIISWLIRFKSGLIKLDEHFLPFSDYVEPLLIIIPTYIVIYYFVGLYKPYRTQSYIDEFFNLLKANTIGIGLFLSLLYIFKNVHYSRYMLSIFGISCLFFNSAERFILRYILRSFRKRGQNIKHVLIVGFSELALEYIKRMDENKHWGYHVAGVIDDDEKLELNVHGVNRLGGIDDLEGLLAEHDYDEVVITLQLKEYHLLGKIIDICEKTGVFTRIIPDYNKYIPSRPYIEDIDGIPIISIRHVPLNDYINLFLKRSLDLLGSFFGIILLSPLLLLLTLLVKFTSDGPIFFKQERVGFNRQPFYIYKFRTMYVQETAIERKSWTTKGDPRITPLGAFLRKTSLDELPQLFNVLVGQMSLIGPRPERPYFVEKFKEEIPKYMIKHQVRPGMTGWAQVHGWRGDTSISKRIEYDLYYIENWSFVLDIKILVMTFFKKSVNKNAY